MSNFEVYILTDVSIDLYQRWRIKIFCVNISVYGISVLFQNMLFGIIKSLTGACMLYLILITL